jgi:squalene-hopene/tetraprenyl-beta-curcumene cyclase
MKVFYAAVLLTAVTVPTALSDEPPAGASVATTRSAAAGISPSLAREGQAAVQRGVKWLLSQQSADGHWSNPDFPALTALPLWALLKSGERHPEATRRAIQYILSCVHEDGSIWREPREERKGGGLSTYNTAICMVALHLANDPQLASVVQKARRFIAMSQHLGDDIYEGGMGYDPQTGRPYADLSNSYIAYEAMRLTQNLEDLQAAAGERVDLDWAAAQRFLARLQSLPGTNAPDWVGRNPDERGGFIYRPDQSQAGTFTDTDGVIRFRTYGSMTYAGLLSLIYSEVDRSDPRVVSAFDWAQRHWTLEENPGIGQEGLYYFYDVLAKALAVYGQDVLHPPGGQPINWREEIIRKLVNLQKSVPETGEGYWVNEQGRWWESDPVLVTAYSLIALEVALGL